jgi:hypothetical protein
MSLLSNQEDGSNIKRGGKVCKKEKIGARKLAS